MKPLQNLDAGFLALESPTSRLHVGALIVIEPPQRSVAVDRFDEIRTLISRRLVQVPAFRQRALRVAFGLQHPVWVDDPDFDLTDHVSRLSLRSPGDARALGAVVAEVMSRPLDLARPLWEMVVVDGLPDERTAVIAKLHHSILDGVSAALLLGSFLDLTPDADFGPEPEPWDPPPLPSPAELFGQGAVSLVRQPGLGVSALRRLLDVVVELSTRNRGLATEGKSPPPALFSGPRTSINGSISSRRSFASVSVPVASIKAVRHAFDVTFNDVVLAAVAGGLRSLLEARGDPIDQALTALVPMSIRTEAEHGAFGNRISAMLVSLATDTKDPLERLRAVSGSATAAKAQEEVLSGSLLGELAQLTVPVFASLAARCISETRLFDRVPPPFNLTMSTIPGPTFDLWWAGGRLAGLYPIGPITDGVALNITAMSYEEGLYLGLLGDRRLLPDMGDLADRIVESLDELVQVAAFSTEGGA